MQSNELLAVYIRFWVFSLFDTILFFSLLKQLKETE